MKQLMLLSVLICVSPFLNTRSFAQSPEWLWAKGAGGTDTDMPNSVAVDASGNTYVTGKFSSSTLTFGSTILTNTGFDDVFLAKYDANGNVLWARNAAGADDDIPNAVVTDALGNVYLTGRFKSSNLTFGSVILANSGQTDIFLAKYDSDGNVVWAKSIGGMNYDAGNAIVADASDNIYLAGYFSSPAITFGITILTNVGSYDMFLAKFDADGNVLWAKSVGDTDDDGINAVASDAAGNAYVTGYFGSPTITFGTTTLTNAGIFDIFLAKFDAGGNVIWAQSAGGTGDDEAYTVVADASGNSYSAGYFYSPAITFGSIPLTNVGIQDMYLVKYDAEGNVLWAKSAGGTNFDLAYAVAVDVSNNAYLTGYFESPTITFSATILTNTGNGDMFLAMYDADGNVRWANSAGGTNFDAGKAVAADASGNIYSAGYFSSSEITFGDTTLNNAGNGDIFLAKLESSITTINEGSQSDRISVFPNPAKDKICIEIPSKGTLFIHTTSGQPLLQQTITESTTTIDVSEWKRGIYLVKVVGEKGVSVGKLIKQ